MKSVVAILLLIGCGFVQADVYKWTDEHGEVHFGQTEPPGNSEKVMTQEQIQQIEQSDQARPQSPAPTGADPNIDQDLQFRASECQRFKGLREAYLLNSNNAENYRMYMALRTQSYPMAYGTDNNSSLAGYGEIEAGIRKYCQD